MRTTRHTPDSVMEILFLKKSSASIRKWFGEQGELHSSNVFFLYFKFTYSFNKYSRMLTLKEPFFQALGMLW